MLPAEAYLAKARQCLDEARAVLKIDLMEAAGRAAYLAAFHAAPSLIVQETGKFAKTHAGVRTEFARLAKDNLSIDRSLVVFLTQAYNLKSIADYAIDSSANIGLADAMDAIEQATLFVDVITAFISRPSD